MLEQLARLGRVGIDILYHLGRAHLLLLSILGGLAALSQTEMAARDADAPVEGDVESEDDDLDEFGDA